jgi:hypothetical protein
MSAKDSRPDRTSRWQRIFALLFVLSLALFLAVRPRLPAPGIPIPEDPDETASLLVAAASLLTALTSLAGLVWTTYSGWRKEKREDEKAHLERARHELEIEKLKRELEAAQGERGAANGVPPDEEPG